MSYLHRLFWAIVTKRNAIAEQLWADMPDPVVGALLASHTYRCLATREDPLLQEQYTSLAEEYDRRATGILDELGFLSTNSTYGDVKVDVVQTLLNEPLYRYSDQESLDAGEGNVAGAAKAHSRKSQHATSQAADVVEKERQLSAVERGGAGWGGGGGKGKGKGGGRLLPRATGDSYGDTPRAEQIRQSLVRFPREAGAGAGQSLRNWQDVENCALLLFASSHLRPAQRLAKQEGHCLLLHQVSDPGSAPLPPSPPPPHTHTHTPSLPSLPLPRCSALPSHGNDTDCSCAVRCRQALCERQLEADQWEVWLRQAEGERAECVQDHAAAKTASKAYGKGGKDGKEGKDGHSSAPPLATARERRRELAAEVKEAAQRLKQSEREARQMRRGAKEAEREFGRAKKAWEKAARAHASRRERLLQEASQTRVDLALSTDNKTVLASKHVHLLTDKVPLPP
jgi:hypothetical protein